MTRRFRNAWAGAMLSAIGLHAGPVVAQQPAPPPAQVKAASPDERVRQCIAKTHALRKNALCDICKGDGQVSVRVQVGERSAGPFTVPVFEKQKTPCTTCKGCGLAKSERLWTLLTEAAAALVNLPAQHAKRAEAVARFRDTVEEVFVRRGNTMAGHLEPRITERLSGIAVPLGKPFVAVIEATHDFKDAKEPGRMIGGKVHGASFSLVLAEAKLTNFDDGDLVLVGGTLAGPIAGNEGREHFVLQGGFALRIDRPDDRKVTK